MSLEQPVVLVPSRYDQWAVMAAEVMDLLRARVLGVQFEHIGSTAVPDLPAKDVVDLLVGVEAERVVSVARQLGRSGFDLEGEREHHCWLSYPTRCDRTYVLHVVEYGGSAWRKRIAFRDLLRQDQHSREEYLEAKRMAAESAHGWGDYTRAKGPVVFDLLARSEQQ